MDTPNEQKIRHLTTDEIKKGCVEISGDDAMGARICRINEELEQGMTSMEAYTHSVTFYGSARFREGHPYYEKARNLAYRLAKELDVTVTTGGGLGIMEAGNRGAFEAGGKSLGLSIELPNEQTTNKYLTDQVPFYFFFARKVTLSFSATTFIFFPGGYGTLDEFFEAITLVQTKKIDQVPIVLFGSDFWKPLETFIHKVLLEQFATISPTDPDLFVITDDPDVVIATVKNAKPRMHTID